MKQIYLIIIIMLAFSISLYAQDAGTFSLSIKPGAYFHLGESKDRFRPIGLTTSVDGDYVFRFTDLLLLRTSIDYTMMQSLAETNLHAISLSVGPGLNISIKSRINIKLYAAGGYYIGMYGDTTAGNPILKTGLDFAVNFNPTFSLEAGACYTNFFEEDEPLSQGMSVYIGAGFKFGNRGERANIEINNVNILPIFPVFFKYYDDNSFGEMTIVNTEGGRIENLTVSFYIKQYMDGPKQIYSMEQLGNGASVTVPLYALLTDSVLEITEATKVQADIILEYSFLDSERKSTHSETIRLYDRNAITWDDDRKAAAFITSKDSTILAYSKSIAGTIGDVNRSSISNNFKTAMALFESLGLYNINYVVDPKTPYAELSENTETIDYCQFPLQTLAYKAGDCDDLSILFNALLESIGIETAFITIPGHIFTAFALEISPEEAAGTFLRPEDLIIIEDKVWVPVEITMVQDGFLDAWQTGAREWRENSGGSADFYPVHEAWETFEPVAMTGEEFIIAMPDTNAVLNQYEDTINTFIEREIQTRVAALESEISRNNNEPRLVNRLGVLYAKYGLLDKAEEKFRSILENHDYLSAIVNLGNIYYLKSDFNNALTYFNRAYGMSDSNASILVGLAKVNYELENYGSAKQYYTKLETIDPELALKYDYLTTRDEGTGRASYQSNKEALEWDE